MGIGLDLVCIFPLWDFWDLVFSICSLCIKFNLSNVCSMYHANNKVHDATAGDLLTYWVTLGKGNFVDVHNQISLKVKPVYLSCQEKYC